MTSAQSQLNAIAAKVKRKQTEVFQASTIRLGQRIINASPVDKGTFKNSWNTAIGAPEYDTTRPDSASGSDSLNELTQVMSSAQVGAVAYFTNPQPYGPRIEYDGWSDQAPNGVVRINAMSWDDIVKEEVAKRR